MGYSAITSTIKFSCAALAAAVGMGAAASSAEATILYATNGTSIYSIDTSASGTVYSTMTQNGPYYINAAGTASTTTPNLRGLGIDSSGNLYSASNGNWAAFKMTVSGNSYTPSYLGSPNGGSNSSAMDSNIMYIGVGATLKRVIPNGASSTYARIGGSNQGSITGITVTDDGALHFISGGPNGYFVYSVNNAAAMDPVASDPSSVSSVAYATAFASITDDGSNVYVSTTDSRSVLKLNGDQSFSTLFTLDLGWTPGQLAFDDASDHLFVVARNVNLTSLFEYDLSGTKVGTYVLPGGSVMSGLVVAPVPEAASLSMLVIGSSALLLRRRKA